MRACVDIIEVQVSFKRTESQHPNSPQEATLTVHREIIWREAECERQGRSGRKGENGEGQEKNREGRERNGEGQEKRGVGAREE